MSGLSTIGIISFGLALVAGRKRLPMRLRGRRLRHFSQDLDSSNIFRSSASSSTGDAELMRLFKLGSRVVAGDHVIGVFRHRAHHLPPRLRINSIASSRVMPGQRPRKHEGLAPESAAADGDFSAWTRIPCALAGAQSGSHRAIDCGARMEFASKARNRRRPRRTPGQDLRAYGDAARQ